MSNGFVDAVRKNSRILFGISGPTGSGKTYSSLRLATGLAQGGIIAYIDTERGRALDYADSFKFKYVELDEPFTPQRYIEKLDEAEALNPTVVVVDSGSHEWTGVGGCQDMHEAIVDRLAGDDYGKRERVSWGAWNKPKQEDRKFISRLTRMRSHIIVCLRAEEKTEMIDDPDKPGKKKIVPKRLLSGHVGWIPQSSKALPYELTLSLVVTPDKPGWPHAIKLPEPLKPFVPLEQPLSEETGRALAAWAAGSAKAEGELGGGTAEEAPDTAKTNAAPSPIAVISADQLAAFTAAVRANKMTRRQVKELLLFHTGQDAPDRIPRESYSDVLAAIGAAT